MRRWTMGGGAAAGGQWAVRLSAGRAGCGFGFCFACFACRGRGGHGAEVEGSSAECKRDLRESDEESDEMDIVDNTHRVRVESEGHGPVEEITLERKPTKIDLVFGTPVRFLSNAGVQSVRLVVDWCVAGSELSAVGEGSEGECIECGVGGWYCGESCCRVRGGISAVIPVLYPVAWVWTEPVPAASGGKGVLARTRNQRPVDHSDAQW
ncbi:hypothetical protein DFH08DRAFT_868164 [Mycena albidolilacea]|uniref:Uncharacterized protein n=1 Tax=Mycena albidolilacea TaxID=1033008 RepID=A0AAD7A1G9_9AGAR|nr:hypothetical protein DFH08DRAFT_868164 [Mycena albidolilacea]